MQARAVVMLKASFSNTMLLLQQALDRNDTGAPTVDAVLSELDDGGAGWLSDGFAEFRHLIVKADVSAAGALGTAIDVVKQRVAEAEGSGHAGVFSRSNLDALLRGVTALVTGRDGPAAIEHLMPLTVSTRYDESLRWSAWVWMTAATASVGNFAHAKTAADTALTLAGHLDGFARAVSLATRSALDVRMREADAAFHRIALAGRILEDAGHQREMSCLWLLLAGLLMSAGREREALRAASQAVDGDPDWPRPAIFLARRALLAGRSDEARRLLLPLHDGEPRPPEIDREMRLIEGVRAGLMPLSLILEYLWIADRPSNDDVAQQLVSFAAEHPRQWLLHETMAWDLLQAGLGSAARSLFDRLCEDASVDQPIRVSAQDGLRRIEENEGEAFVIGPLQLVQRYLQDHEEDHLPPDLDQHASAHIFWVRRAVETGNLDEAEDLLMVLDEADTGVEELAQEQRFLDAINGGAIPVSVASEYVWIRERPLTDELVAQVRALAEEYTAILPLRVLMAWDLARDGYLQEASAQFLVLLEEPQLDDDLREAVERGIEYAKDYAHRERGLGRAEGIAKASAQLGLSRFVWAKQQWPSVLDLHPLLFIGKSEALPKQVLELGREVSVAEGQHIHSQGKEGELLYCLVAGEAMASRARGTIHEVATIAPGFFFGEIGTLFGLPNTASVIASKRSSLLVIGRQLLQRQMQFDRQGSAPVLLNKFKQLYLEAVLDISPVSSGEQAGELWQISGDTSWRTYQKGEVLAEAGKPTSPALLIYGIARVYVPRGPALTPVGYLCPGDLVGELRPSPVTVRAENTLTTVSLDRGLLEKLARDSTGEMHLRMKACLEAAGEFRS